MTKAEIISLVKNTLMKVDEQGRYREPLLERHIGVVYEQMFNELYGRDRKSISKYTRIISDASSEAVNLANGRTLPSIPIVLPREAGGLFEFYTDAGFESFTFVLTSYEGYKYSVDSSFDTASFKGTYTAAILADKIYANKTVTPAPAGEVTLYYRMIPKFSELSSTDEVILPGGASEMLVDRVIDTIQHMPPTDLINDNTV